MALFDYNQRYALGYERALPFPQPTLGIEDIWRQVAANRGLIGAPLEDSRQVTGSPLRQLLAWSMMRPPREQPTPGYFPAADPAIADPTYAGAAMAEGWPMTQGGQPISGETGWPPQVGGETLYGTAPYKGEEQFPMQNMGELPQQQQYPTVFPGEMPQGEGLAGGADIQAPPQYGIQQGTTPGFGDQAGAAPQGGGMLANLQGRIGDYWPAVLAAAGGLLGASGWSKMPVSMGQALAAGIEPGVGTYLGLRRQYEQEAQQREMLGQRKAEMEQRGELGREQLAQLRETRQAQVEERKARIEAGQRMQEMQKRYQAAVQSGDQAAIRGALAEMYPETLFKSLMESPDNQVTEIGIGGDKAQKAVINKRTGEVVAKIGEPYARKAATEVKVAVSGFGKTAIGELEKKIIDTASGLNRLQRIRDSFKPEYMTWARQLESGAAALQEKAGIPLSEEQKAKQKEYTDFKRRTLANISLYIKEITGAAMQEAEAKRITAGMPNMDDSATEFQAKLNSTLDELEVVLEMYEAGRVGGPEGMRGESSMKPSREEAKDPWE